MTKHIIHFNLQATTRTEMRKELIQKFLEELPGTGTGELASKYKYIVEKFGKYEISLNRPALLNKGFDYTVNISEINFLSKKGKKRNYPAHDDIYNALENCKQLYSQEYPAIKQAIQDIFNCKTPTINNINAYFFDYENTQHPIQVILLTIKWLFLEQDYTYWNYSGRNMFYNGLKDRDLV